MDPTERLADLFRSIIRNGTAEERTNASLLALLAERHPDALAAFRPFYPALVNGVVACHGERTAGRAVRLMDAIARLLNEDLVRAIQVPFLPSHAFEELFGRLAIQIELWACEAGASDDDARDIAQEISLQIWETRLRGFDASRDLRPYLVTITRNRVKQWQRKKKPQSLESWDLLPDEAEAARSRLADLDESIRVGIDSLPSDQKDILNRVAAGAGRQEVAAALGLPVAKVDQLLTKARKALRAFLRQNGVPISRRLSFRFLKRRKP